MTRQPGDDGTVLHAELRRGDVIVMLATADADVDVIYGAAIEECRRWDGHGSATAAVARDDLNLRSRT